MANVLLLRAPSSDTGKDPYEEQFQSRGYRPISLPVLETVQMNSEELQKIIATGPTHQDIQGVVITSNRAANSWKYAVKTLITRTDLTADWSAIPFYVVGNSTAESLKDIALLYPSSMSPIDIRGAQESGTSERLGKFILSDIVGGSATRFLYLTGDKNRETLPCLLKDSGLELLSLKVYETRGSSSFAKGLESVVKTFQPGVGAKPEPCWVVFFAPSAADFAVPFLQKVFCVGIANRPGERLPAKVATIGATTSEHLRNKLAIAVDVVSTNPSAGDLVDSILNFCQRRADPSVVENSPASAVG